MKWAGLGLVVILLFLLHLVIGSVWIPIGEVIESLVRWDQGPVVILRLPRAVACLLVGCSLGMSGSALQALFRNPLADPYVCGVSSGAAVGGACALAAGLGAGGPGLAVMGFSMAGGIGAVALVTGLATTRHTYSAERLLIAGVMVSSILAAVLSLILLWAGYDTRYLLNWLLGSITPAYWINNLALLVCLAIGGTVLVMGAKRLNALALGEDAARRIGVGASRLRWIVLAATTLLVASTVGAVGIIGFLGLAAPHIARRVFGVDWRGSLVASGAIGAALLSGADIIAQVVVASAEVPVGIVTAILGAPFLLVLIRKSG